jgi:hypothetical protein
MIPTLSQVHWQDRNEAHSLDWRGFAGDALRERTASDYIVASDHADQLRGTSQIARQQAGELERLRNGVLYAVDDAHNAGFSVAEDLSVTDTRTQPHNRRTGRSPSTGPSFRCRHSQPRGRIGWG